MRARKVELIKQKAEYQLTVDGSPFYIKGAGLELGSIQSLADYGGNAFRTWRVDNGEKSGREILDDAQHHGLMVCMGLDVARERHGFDYSDKKAVAAQLATIRKDILALKDHPALLMWGIGNELNLHHKNPKVWDAVNDISKMIHRIDPNHPTTTMLAGAEPAVIKLVSKRCPDLDLLSLQLYGDISHFPRYLTKSGYLGAYIISEWGVTGHWESPCTGWDRPFEATSSEKAKHYQQRYVDYILSDKSHCIGSFVFLWGQKQERTPTWYGMFLENGEHTESAQVMQQLWTDQRPPHPVARLIDFSINNLSSGDSIRLQSNAFCSATVKVNHSDPVSLQYRWELLKEVERQKQSDGGDFEPRPETVWQQITQGTRHPNGAESLKFKAPANGEYRLFIYVDDRHGGTATANLPLLVESLPICD